MDGGEPAGLGTDGAALSERSERCRMGADRADNPAGQARRTAARGEGPRKVLNAIFYILSTGCQWRALPKDLPARSTVHDYFDLWNWDGTLDRLHHALYEKCREEAGRETSPTAAIIDSQSVKAAEKGGPRSIRTGLTPARRSRARSAISW